MLQWSRRGSNPRPLQCHCSALPAELRPQRSKPSQRPQGESNPYLHLERVVSWPLDDGGPPVSDPHAPGRTRTCDPRLRRPMLYPPELRARPPESRELATGVEPVTSSLPRTRSTTELRERTPRPFQQGRRDSNPQPPVLETGALPVELRPFGSGCRPTRRRCHSHAMAGDGIEPPTPAFSARCSTD